jgi:hypothetical protein
MLKNIKEEILISFLNIKDKYKKLGKFIIQLIQDDPSSPKELKGLLFELQLRTILEEAWSEIDHKYRYVRSRIGVNLPEYINAGFYNLSAYLQVAALQAENLCRMSEAHSLKKTAKGKEIERILFVNAKEGNIDLINALNFGIFYEGQGKRVAQEGLRSVLRWRKSRLNC